MLYIRPSRGIYSNQTRSGSGLYRRTTKGHITVCLPKVNSVTSLLRINAYHNKIVYNSILQLWTLMFILRSAKFISLTKKRLRNKLRMPCRRNLLMLASGRLSTRYPHTFWPPLTTFQPCIGIHAVVFFPTRQNIFRRTLIARAGRCEAR